MQLSNVSGNVVAGQATSLDVTSTDGGPVTWSSSLGSTFSPNPSPDGGSSDSSTTYTPAAVSTGTTDTDIITATDGSGDTAMGSIPVTAAGGGGGSSGGYTISAAGAAAVLAASAAMTGVDLTTTAACAPVMAMQTAWNSNGGTPALTAIDGKYGTDSADALAAAASMVAGQGNVPAAVTTFPNCGGSPTPTVTCPDGSVHPAGYVCPGSSPIQPSGGMPKWLKWLLIVLAAGAVGTIGYLIYKKQNGSGASEPKRRRSKRRRRVTRARKGKRR